MESPLSDYVRFSDEEDDYVPGSPMMELSLPPQTLNIPGYISENIRTPDLDQRNPEVFHNLQPTNGTQHELTCLLYTSPSPRDQRGSRMPSSA